MTFYATRSAALLALLLSSSPTAHAVDPRGKDAQDLIGGADAALAWRMPLPVGFTTSIRSYELVDGTVYAIGNDGRVRAVDAVTGRYMWTVSVGQGEQRIWGPVAYRSENMNAAVFTTFSKAVLVDVPTGRVVKQSRLSSPATASVVAFDKLLFCPAVNSRLWCLDIERSTPLWQLGTRGPIDIPPAYLVDADLLVFADNAGYVHGSDSDRHPHFRVQITGKPVGWIASDKTTLYITTSGDVQDIHALSIQTGEPSREPYRLNGRPSGGPIITQTSLYQSLADGGVHRLALASDGINWFDPHARTFLAEWPGRTSLLRKDGSIEFVETQTGRALQTLNPGVSFKTGVSNPVNDEAIVATDDGEVWAFRPANAGQINLASFHAASTQPTSRPVHTRPARESGSTIFTYVPAGGGAPAGRAAGGGSPLPVGVAAPPAQPARPGKAAPEEHHSRRAQVAGQLDRALNQRGR